MTHGANAKTIEGATWCYENSTKVYADMPFAKLTKTILSCLITFGLTAITISF